MRYFDSNNQVLEDTKLPTGKSYPNIVNIIMMLGFYTIKDRTMLNEHIIPTVMANSPNKFKFSVDID